VPDPEERALWHVLYPHLLPTIATRLDRDRPEALFLLARVISLAVMEAARDLGNYRVFPSMTKRCRRRSGQGRDIRGHFRHYLDLDRPTALPPACAICADCLRPPVARQGERGPQDTAPRSERRRVLLRHWGPPGSGGLARHEPFRNAVLDDVRRAPGRFGEPRAPHRHYVPATANCACTPPTPPPNRAWKRARGKRNPSGRGGEYTVDTTGVSSREVAVHTDRPCCKAGVPLTDVSSRPDSPMVRVAFRLQAACNRSHSPQHASATPGVDGFRNGGDIGRRTPARAELAHLYDYDGDVE
jgi:hypothetical protein